MGGISWPGNEGMEYYPPTPKKTDGDSDHDQDVDGEDLGNWTIQFGTIFTTPVTAAITTIEPARMSSLAAESAGHSADSLSADLVDAAIAMDQVMHSSSPSRLTTSVSPMEDRIDWSSYSNRWSQQPIWQGLSLTANNSDRYQTNDISINRDADTIDGEVLDKLFAENETDLCKTLPIIHLSCRVYTIGFYYSSIHL